MKTEIEIQEVRLLKEKANRIKKNSKGIWGEVWHRLKKNKLSMFGLYILAAVLLIAVFAPVISPYEYDYQDVENALQFPSKNHLFGTDNFGRDMLSRMIYGSRISLQVGFISVGVSGVFGCILGALAAFYRKFDDLIMRVMDLIAGIPNLLLAIAIAAVLGSGVRNLMIAIGISAIPQYARIMRASAMTEKGKEYVEAAESIGADSSRIIIRHILPNAFSPVLVQATLGIATSILSAAALSFLGLGIKPPSPEWGAMLSAGRVYIRDYWHMTVIPGMAIMIVVYAFNTLGDGLRDALDPRLKN
ncbi:MAG: ABC transporter permease [Clostridiaceae bacterium]|jgi:peptide/nickel transport system permease protein|nr:ABC transporter permease [Clostridiaceae bacterium]